MCLSIPAKVLSIEKDIARVSVGGSELSAGLHLVDDIRIGDYVLLHCGFAIQKISEENALEMLSIFNEIAQSEAGEI